MIVYADFLYEKMRDFFNTQIITSSVELNIYDILYEKPLDINQIMDKIKIKNNKIKYLMKQLEFLNLIEYVNNKYYLLNGYFLRNGTNLNLFIREISSTEKNNRITLYDEFQNFHKSDSKIDILKLAIYNLNIVESKIYEKFIGFIDVQIIYSAIKNNIIEELNKKPMCIFSLINKCPIDFYKLIYIIDRLIVLKIINKYDNTYYLSKAGKLLLKDSEFCVCNICDFMACETYSTWRHLNYFFRNDKPCFFIRHDNLVISKYLSIKEERSIIFCNFLAERTKWLYKMILKYKFHGNVVDIAGSDGKILRYICDYNNIKNAVLYELPDIIQNVQKNKMIFEENKKRNIKYIAGNFLEKNNNIPLNSDYYFMSRVIQDWTDDKIDIILNNIHNAMSDKSKLLVLDYAFNEDDLTKYDVNAILDLACISPCGTMRSKNNIIDLFTRNKFIIEKCIQNTESDYRPYIFVLKKIENINF